MIIPNGSLEITRNNFWDVEEDPDEFAPVITNEGRLFLVGIVENNADHIYYYSFDENSEGFFGGSRMFLLESGERLLLTAPWKSNSLSLFAETGVDIRDRHSSWTIVARKRRYSERHFPLYEGILYLDHLPTIGLRNRGEIIAREIRKALGEDVFCHTIFPGGTSCAWIGDK